MNLPAHPQPQGFPMHMAPAGSFGAPTMAPPPVWSGITPEQKVELLEYWRSVLKRKWAILALALAVAVVAGVVAMGMPAVYRATTVVLVEANQQRAVPIEDIYSNNQNYEHYQTQVELLKSRELAMRTAHALKLWDHPLYDPRVDRPTWSQRLLAEMGIGSKKEVRTDWTEEQLVNATVGVVRGGLTITPVRGSQLIQVHFNAADRELAARVANTHAREYIEADRDERYKLTQQVSQQLTERLVTLREQLTKSEKALQAFRESKGIVQLSAQAGANAKTGPFESLTTKLLDARAKRLELESSYQQARSSSADSAIPAVMRDLGVSDAQRNLAAAQAKLAELQQRLGSEHDQIKQAKGEVDAARDLMNRRQAVVVRSILREYEVARDTEVGIEKTLKSAKAEVQGTNRDEFELTVLEREYQSNRQLFDLFLTRAKETNLVGNVQASVARIADRAVPPGGAIAPDRQRIVMMAALVALVLGALASVAIDKLDNTIKGGEDAEVRLRSPVIATLPLVEGATRKKMARAMLEEAHSHYAEGIRTARTGVLLSSLDAKNRVLLITSSLPGEGKTTVSINLAMAHAQTTRTLLIDCDLRRAQVSYSLGLGIGHKGLTHLVSGNADESECVVPVKNTGLWVLPVGELPPNPLELIISQKFKDTLAKLSTQFEMIIIDSPPVELVSEALMLAPLATNVALVVKAMSTPAPLIRKTQQRLQRAGGNVMGVVINGLDFAHARRYYGEYAHSTYTYGGDGYKAYIPGAKSKNEPLTLKTAAKRLKDTFSRDEDREAA